MLERLLIEVRERAWMTGELHARIARALGDE